MATLKNAIASGVISEVKSMARERAGRAIGSVFGSGIVGETLQRVADKKFGKKDERVSPTTIVNVQKEMAGTLLRIEVIAQNISDNLYNIAGVLNAQITSMEQTRRDMAVTNARELAAREEAGATVGAGAKDAKGLTKGDVVSALLARAAVRSAPVVAGGLIAALGAALLKMAIGRSQAEFDDSKRGAGKIPAQQVARGEYKTLREAAAANRRNALKSRETITRGVADDIVDVLIQKRMNGNEAAMFIREFSPEADLYYVLDTCSPAKRKKFLETVGEVIPAQKPVPPPPLDPRMTHPAATNTSGGRMNVPRGDILGATPEGESVTPAGSPLSLHTPSAPGLAPVFEATPVSKPGVSRSMSSQNENPIKRIVETGPGFNIVERPDGTIERQDGDRNWRNNNPGNIEYGDFAKKMGAIGTDGRFAIFPDFSTGRKAKEELIFAGKNYKNLSLTAAIARYAPPSENDTAAYQQNVLSAVGGQNKLMSEYSQEERTRILDAFQRQEGFRKGRTVAVSTPSTGQIATAAPSTGTKIAAASTQVAAAIQRPPVNNNVNVINGGSGRIAPSPAPSGLPSPVADRGSLDENTMFIAAA